MAIRKDAIMKHSKWLHFLPPRRLCSRMIQHQQLIEDEQQIEKGPILTALIIGMTWTLETVKRDCTSYGKGHSFMRMVTWYERDCCVISSAFVAPIGLYLQQKAISDGLGEESYYSLVEIRDSLKIPHELW